jgi:hypothetical protein
MELAAIFILGALWCGASYVKSILPRNTADSVSLSRFPHLALSFSQQIHISCALMENLCCGYDLFSYGVLGYVCLSSSFLLSHLLLCRQRVGGIEFLVTYMLCSDIMTGIQCDSLGSQRFATKLGSSEYTSNFETSKSDG